MSSYRHKSFVSSKKRKLIVKHLTLLLKGSLHGRIFSKYTELFNSENIFKTFFTCNIPKTYFENILKMFSECSQQYF